MDDSEIEDTHKESSEQTQKTVGDIFKEWFPFYLNCGMTYEQYWEESSDLVIPYFCAYIQKRDEDNYFLWLSGAYTFAAFSAALGNFGAGLAGKNGTAKYLDKPIQIRGKTQEEIDREIEEKRKKFVKSLNRFHARMEAKNAEQ